MAHEIMNYDNMFSVKVTPWHGLGVILNDPPSVDEALKQANLDWSVSLLPLFCQLPNSCMEQVDRMAVVREDTNEVLGVVGNNYTPLQNIDAFDIFQPLVETKELLLETGGSLKNGRRVWIFARINVDGAEIGKGDEIKPYVLLSNSHDGTMAARFGFTPIRVVCNNTLTAAENNGTSKLVKLVHKSNIYDNLQMLRDMLDLSKARFEATIEQYKILANRDINSSDLEKYVKIVLTDSDEADTILTPTQNRIIDLFENGIGSDLPKMKTWWGAYNSVNEWLMYHRGRSVDNRLASVWYADGYNLNKRALDIALKLAA